MKSVNVSIRKSNYTMSMKKQGVRNEVQSTAKVKIYVVNLTQRGMKRGNKAKTSYGIGSGRFVFSKMTLTRFTLKLYVGTDLIMYDTFK
jgi:hypothetical protein